MPKSPRVHVLAGEGRLARKPTTVTTGKFSRAFLMGLREGLEIYTTSPPLLKERVAPLARRAGQWRRFKSAGVSGKTCIIHDPA